jgi:hypothetical protein
MLRVHLRLQSPSAPFVLKIDTSGFEEDVGCCRPDIEGTYPVKLGGVGLYVLRQFEIFFVGNQRFELTTALE